MFGKSQKPSQDSPRVGTRQQIKQLVGNLFSFARRHTSSQRSILKEKKLSVRVQAGSETHTQPITSQPTFTLGWGVSHTTLAAPSQVFKLEVVRDSTPPPAQIIDSCGAAIEQLLQTPGLGDTRVLSGQDTTPKRRCRGPTPSPDLVTGSRRNDAGSRTFALIIGIDKYQSSRKPQLQGAVNDARAMAQLLQSLFGVPSGNICILCDQDATRSRILAEFKSLITNSNIRRGDAIIIYFAGHGSQARAPDGWRAEGGMVETICPVDEEFQEGDAEIHGIPDRTIARLVSKLSKAKGKNITLIFDCCHSGGIARGDSAKTIYRYAPTASSLPAYLDADILLEVQPIKAEDTSNPLPTYVLLAACRPNERARETVSADGKPCGAFSESLFRHLETCGPATTYAELLRSVAQDLGNHFQHPICEGENRDSPLFQGRAVKQNNKLFTVSPDGDGGYCVTAGSLHGIVPGSLFSILQVDSQSGLSREIGILEARTVSTGSSILQAKEGSSFAVPSHCKAAVLSWGPSDNLLNIHTEGLDPAWMDRAPFYSPRYRVAASPSTSTMTIRSMNSSLLTFEFLYPVSRVSTKQLRPPISFTPLALQHTLNHMNDFHFHLTRSNPSVPSPLKGKVRLRLHRTEGNAISDLFINNHATVTPGATFSFTIINESNLDLFPYLFLFDPNEYSIKKWYYPPAINMEAPLLRGSHGQPSSLPVGSSGSSFGPFSFGIPDGIDSGTVFLKLFFASYHADMDSLEQGSAFTPTAKSLRRPSRRGGGPSRRRRSTGDSWDACCYTVTIRRDAVTDR